MEKKKSDVEISHLNEIEDTTKYGEFVSSYFAWLTLNRQKKRASELEDMTSQDKK